MCWWTTYMEIKKNVSQLWKIRYPHKLKYAFSFLLAMISSLKHLQTGHLVVLMEKMKYVLLKTQSTERDQFKEYSFHLPEVLRHQNKTVCSVLLLHWSSTSLLKLQDEQECSKERASLIKIECGIPTDQHPSLQGGRHSFGLLECIFFKAHVNSSYWEATFLNWRQEAT